MNRRSITFTLVLMLSIAAAQTVSAGWNPQDDKEETRSNTGNRDVDTAIRQLKSKDPGLKLFFNKAYGYAIFPTIGKAGFGLGGAYGEGEVYRQGKFIGTSSLSQLTMTLPAAILSSMRKPLL